MIRLLGLLDEAKYLENNPDVAEAGVDPLTHYYYYGGFEGRDLPPGFYSRNYMSTYDDVRISGLNPLIHYVKIGQKEGRKPTPPVYSIQSMWEYAKQNNGIIFEDSPERIYIHRPMLGGSSTRILNEGEAYCPKPYIARINDVLFLQVQISF